MKLLVILSSLLITLSAFASDDKGKEGCQIRLFAENTRVTLTLDYLEAELKSPRSKAELVEYSHELTALITSMIKHAKLPGEDGGPYVFSSTLDRANEMRDLVQIRMQLNNEIRLSYGAKARELYPRAEDDWENPLPGSTLDNGSPLKPQERVPQQPTAEPKPHFSSPDIHWPPREKP